MAAVGDAAAVGTDDRPASALFAEVIGQPAAVAQLRAAARAPVHAYLFVGPSGAGKAAAARAFAAALLCPDGGCGRCRSCRLALAGAHPDQRVVERAGAFIQIDDVREVVRLASLSPVEGGRKVLVLTDFQLVRDAGPALLKALEEPPASTVFVVIADDVPPELVTIASRCVRVVFGPVPAAAIERALLEAGATPEVAGLATEMAAGDLRRARLLATDAGLAERVLLWRSIPERLDATGRCVAELTDELRAAISASAAPLAAQHAEEAAALDARVAGMGERGAGRRTLEARQRREVRRLREDELRAGLGVLAARYATAAVDAADPAPFLAAVDAVTATAARLVHNPTEELQLWDLLLRLPPLPAAPRRRPSGGG